MTNLVDFSIGVGLTPILILCNLVIVRLCLFFPKSILGLSGVMIALDAIATIGYTFTFGSTFGTDMKLVVGGVGLAIFIALFHKVSTMLNVLGKAFSHEIGN